jgi:glucokinase
VVEGAQWCTSRARAALGGGPFLYTGGRGRLACAGGAWQPASARMPLVGIDLGGTKLAAAVFSDSGEVLERETLPLGGRHGGAAGALIVDVAGRLTRTHAAAAVGVCVPGLYRAVEGTVWAPNIGGWENYPLRDELHSALTGVRVAIDSDRAAYILGETWRGAARGVSDAIFLAVGTGIGAGILAGGQVIRGHSDLAGAVGWMGLDRPFRERWTQYGCLEDQGSGPGLVRVARDYLAQAEGYAGALRGSDVETSDIFAAAEVGDELAVRVITNAVELWGMAAANLVSAFNPQLVVFGGGVFGPAVRLLPRIRAEAEKWGQPLAMRQVEFVASTLGGDAGLIGAGRLAQMTRSAE